MTDLLLEVRGEEGEGNFAGAVGERQRVAGEDLQLVHQVVWQARLLKKRMGVCNDICHDFFTIFVQKRLFCAVGMYTNRKQIS